MSTNNPTICPDCHVALDIVTDTDIEQRYVPGGFVVRGADIDDLPTRLRKGDVAACPCCEFAVILRFTTL